MRHIKNGCLNFLKKGITSCILLFTISLGCFHSHSLSAQPFIYINTDDSLITKVNILNCASSRLGKTGVFLEDIAMCPDRKFYGIGKNFLYSLDTLNGKATKLIEMTGAGDMNGLACDSSSNIFSITELGDLYKIERNTYAYSFVRNIKSGSEGDITFLHDTLYTSSGGATLYADTIKIGQMTNLSHVLGLATLFYGNKFNLPHILLSTQHVSLFITSPKTAFSAPICVNITKSCIRGATSSTDTTGYKFVTSLFQYLIETEVVMPNVFSPNNDLQNDRFVPIIFKGPIANATLEIFNRWGTSIFRTNDIPKGWDGTQFGLSEAPDGVYYWILTYGINESDIRMENIFKPKVIKGYVQMKR